MNDLILKVTRRLLGLTDGRLITLDGYGNGNGYGHGYGYGRGYGYGYDHSYGYGDGDGYGYGYGYGDGHGDGDRYGDRYGDGYGYGDGDGDGKNEDIIGFLTQCRMAHPEAKQALDECTVGKLSDETLFIGFSVDGVKWHSGYTDVDCHNILWHLAERFGTQNDLDPNDGCLEGQRCIVGESEDDITTENFGPGEFSLWSVISVSCIMNVDLSLGKKYDIRDNLKEVLCSETATTETNTSSVSPT